MRRLLAAAVALAAAAPAAAVAQAPDAGAIIERAARVYGGLRSLQADFVQVIDDAMIGTYESRGTLVQSGQNRLSMRFSDPKGDAIVMDGRYLWAYTPSTTPGQVIRLPVPAGPAYGFNVLGWLLDRPTERYRVRWLKRDFVNFVQVDVVELEPLDPELPFRRAVLWLDRDRSLPQRLLVEERSGATRTLTLSRLRTNVAVSDGTFRFDVPSGVRVIEQGA